MRTGGVVLAILSAAAAVSICAAQDQTADKMFDGKYLFGVSCADCHGAVGQGVTLFGPPLAGDAFITASPDETIGKVINMGRKYRDKMHPDYMGMPKFQYITGGQLQALVDYLKGPLQGPATK
jgi:mono/diheme cytochrome c family protein